MDKTPTRPSDLRHLLDVTRNTEESWRLLMESIKDFALVLVDTDGRIATWNTAAARLFGYENGEILGAPLECLFLPEDVARGLPARELDTAKREGRASDDNWLRRKDGSRFWASGATTALADRGERLIGFAKVVRDLTERKLAEDRLRAANQRLEDCVADRTRELQLRVRELEGFASSVAHDLRAPLRAIHRYAELVRLEYRDRPLDPEGDEAVGRIIESAESMDSLIRHLLAYSRLDQVRVALRPVDPDGVVAEALRALTFEIQERGAVLEVERPLRSVRADPDLLLETLLNLLSNAIKFVPAGIQPRVRVRSEPRDANVRLWVEDNGIGIAPEHQERIFLPFERLHASDEYPGTGIGLAIARKAAERAGGKVGVDSRIGYGSRFWVELPAARISEA
jgi:PAS domain S-box-containing protein